MLNSNPYFENDNYSISPAPNPYAWNSNIESVGNPYAWDGSIESVGNPYSNESMSMNTSPHGLNESGYHTGSPANPYPNESMPMNTSPQNLNDTTTMQENHQKLHTEEDPRLQGQDGFLHEREDALLPEQDGILHEQSGLLSEQNGILHEQNGLLQEQDDFFQEQDGSFQEQDDLLHIDEFEFHDELNGPTTGVQVEESLEDIEEIASTTGSFVEEWLEPESEELDESEETENENRGDYGFDWDDMPKIEPPSSDPKPRIYPPLSPSPRGKGIPTLNGPKPFIGESSPTSLPRGPRRKVKMKAPKGPTPRPCPECHGPLKSGYCDQCETQRECKECQKELEGENLSKGTICDTCQERKDNGGFFSCPRCDKPLEHELYCSNCLLQIRCRGCYGELEEYPEHDIWDSFQLCKECQKKHEEGTLRYPKDLSHDRHTRRRHNTRRHTTQRKFFL